MEITKKWLIEQDACIAGIKWFNGQDETDGIRLVEKLSARHWNWAHWLISKLLSKEDRLKYVIKAAKQVLFIFEDEYPEDYRVRKLIESTEAWVKDPTQENYNAVYKATKDTDDIFLQPTHSFATYAANAARNIAYVIRLPHEAGVHVYNVGIQARQAANYSTGIRLAKIEEKIIDYGLELLKKESS